MADELSPDLSPDSTLMQIQRRPHSTPYHSGTSSSDEGIEGTLFQRVSTRSPNPRQDSITESESMMELCGLLAGFNLASRSNNDDSGRMVDPKKISVVGCNSKGGMDRLSTPANTPDEVDITTEDVDSSDIKGRSDSEDLDVTFVLEAKQRSDERMEQEKDTVFNYLAAAEEQIESYGGNLPKSMRKGVLKHPEESRPSSQMASNHSYSFIPTADTSTTSSDKAERVIKTPDDLIQFKEHPKKLFLALLQKYLASNQINAFVAHEIAIDFVRDLIKKYKYKDGVRHKAFNHLLCHIPIQPYSMALWYLQEMRRASEYRIVENLFLRGCDLEKASALCTLCNNQH